MPTSIGVVRSRRGYNTISNIPQSLIIVAVRALGLDDSSRFQRNMACWGKMIDCCSQEKLTHVSDKWKAISDVAQRIGGSMTYVHIFCVQEISVERGWILR